MATKKTTAKKATAAKNARRRNALLRKLRDLVRAIESVDQKAQRLPDIKKLRNALPKAIRALERDPGTGQKQGG
jgi:hypothetical protein